MPKVALITGITGQDGSYLSNLLLSKEHDVYGTTRNIKKKNLNNLKKLGILNKIKIIKCDIVNFSTINKIIKLCIISITIAFVFCCNLKYFFSFLYSFLK